MSSYSKFLKFIENKFSRDSIKFDEIFKITNLENFMFDI